MSFRRISTQMFKVLVKLVTSWWVTVVPVRWELLFKGLCLSICALLKRIQFICIACWCNSNRDTFRISNQQVALKWFSGFRSCSLPINANQPAGTFAQHYFEASNLDKKNRNVNSGLITPWFHCWRLWTNTGWASLALWKNCHIAILPYQLERNLLILKHTDMICPVV